MGSTVSFNRNQFVLTRFTRELKQRRRRRLGRRQVKNEFIFYKRNLQFSRSVRFANGSKIVLKLNMQRQRSVPNGNTKNEPLSSRFCRRHRTWPFHVLVLQRTAKKCTKSFIIKFPYNARSDWLKQRPFSENKVQVNDIKLAFKFLLRNFDKFDPN